MPLSEPTSGGGGFAVSPIGRIISEVSGGANTGNNVFLVGNDAGEANSGDDIIAIGQQTLTENTIPNVIAIGEFAGPDPIGGLTPANAIGNVYLGALTARNQNAADGGKTVAIGYRALERNIGTGATGFNTVIGADAARGAAPGNAFGIDTTTILGAEAGVNIGSDAFVADNVLIGYRAGVTNTGSTFNGPFGATYVGARAGEQHGQGLGNTAIGSDAMGIGVIDGDFNVVVGSNAGTDISTGAGNVVIGGAAGGPSHTTGSDNVYIGANFTAQNGNRNVLVGAGSQAGTGNDNVALGANIRAATFNALANGAFVVEAVAGAGGNRIPFLWGDMANGNLLLGIHTDAGGLPINRGFAGGSCTLGIQDAAVAGGGNGPPGIGGSSGKALIYYDSGAGVQGELLCRFDNGTLVTLAAR